MLSSQIPIFQRGGNRSNDSSNGRELPLLPLEKGRPGGISGKAVVNQATVAIYNFLDNKKSSPSNNFFFTKGISFCYKYIVFPRGPEKEKLKNLNG
jgi:hypothetical protein